MVTLEEASKREFKIKQLRHLYRLRLGIQTKSYAWADAKVNMINAVDKGVLDIWRFLR